MTALTAFALSARISPDQAMASRVTMNTETPSRIAEKRTINKRASIAERVFIIGLTGFRRYGEARFTSPTDRRRALTDGLE